MENEQLIREFMEITYKESVIEVPTEVTGGLLHKLYKVMTNTGTYAVTFYANIGYKPMIEWTKWEK